MDYRMKAEAEYVKINTQSRTDGDGLDDLVTDHDGTDRNTVGERLSHGDDIRPAGSERKSPTSTTFL